MAKEIKITISDDLYKEIESFYNKSQIVLKGLDVNSLDELLIYILDSFIKSSKRIESMTGEFANVMKNLDLDNIDLNNVKDMKDILSIFNPYKESEDKHKKQKESDKKEEKDDPIIDLSKLKS